MKYLITLSFICLIYSAKGQAKGDTSRLQEKVYRPILRIPEEPESNPSFTDITFLMQQNKELSDRLDRLQTIMDSLKEELRWKDTIRIFNVQMSNFMNRRLQKQIDSLGHDLSVFWRVDNYDVKFLQEQIDTLCQRPYLFIDTKSSRPGVWLTNSAGEYQIFIAPLKR